MTEPVGTCKARPARASDARSAGAFRPRRRRALRGLDGLPRHPAPPIRCASRSPMTTFGRSRWSGCRRGGSAVADQMRELAQQEATQRILVREAMALGLDQDDEIIARRLAQKMDFLLADLATLDEPVRGRAARLVRPNPDLFAMPPRVSFRHLYFAQDARGLDGARAEPRPVAQARRDRPRDRLAGRPTASCSATTTGASPVEVAKEFGTGFAEAILRTGGPGRGRSGRAMAGTWSGSTRWSRATPPTSRRSGTR